MCIVGVSRPWMIFAVQISGVSPSITRPRKKKLIFRRFTGTPLGPRLVYVCVAPIRSRDFLFNTHHVERHDHFVTSTVLLRPDRVSCQTTPARFGRVPAPADSGYTIVRSATVNQRSFSITPPNEALLKSCEHLNQIATGGQETLQIRGLDVIHDDRVTGNVSREAKCAGITGWTGTTTETVTAESLLSPPCNDRMRIHALLRS